MVNKTAIEELDAKISLVLEKYMALKEENMVLKETINSNLITEERLREELLQRKEEDELRDLEIEEISLRIGKSMNLKLDDEKTFIAS